MLPRPNISVLLAVMFADRFLGSVLLPLAVHPVVLVGRLITIILSITPESCFDPQHPVRGFVSGCLLYVMTVTVALGTAALFVLLPFILWLIVSPTMTNDDDSSISTAETCTNTAPCSNGFNDDDVYYPFTTGIYNNCNVQTFTTWFVQVLLLHGSLNIQLLCSIALQMAHFLE
jgi:hypothetical protein